MQKAIHIFTENNCITDCSHHTLPQPYSMRRIAVTTSLIPRLFQGGAWASIKSYIRIYRPHYIAY